MRRLFIQFATVLALVIAPMVAFASPLPSVAVRNLMMTKSWSLICAIKSTRAVTKHF